VQARKLIGIKGGPTLAVEIDEGQEERLKSDTTLETGGVGDQKKGKEKEKKKKKKKKKRKKKT